jgi:hypothetical protein
MRQDRCDRTKDAFSGANLGLYSVTFVNELEQDRETLLAFKEFREEAERKKFRYFLEVFDPNVKTGVLRKSWASLSMTISSAAWLVCRSPAGHCS